MMRRSAARFVLACIPLVGACSPVARDADVGSSTAQLLTLVRTSELTSEPTSDADRLHGFAHLASGEWATTLASGDVLRETWRWEPDGRSLRVVCVGGAPDGSLWREEHFGGEEHFETELLEFIEPDRLVPLTSWIYTRPR
jgi:hypothetical protein